MVVIAIGGAGNRSIIGSSWRTSQARLNRRSSGRPNPGQTAGLTTVRLAGNVSAGAGRHSWPSFSSPRRAVAQSKAGRRVPIMFTQTTDCSGNRCRTRCWQLVGCRPQSSEKTNHGATPRRRPQRSGRGFEWRSWRDPTLMVRRARFSACHLSRDVNLAIPQSARRVKIENLANRIMQIPFIAERILPCGRGF